MGRKKEQSQQSRLFEYVATPTVALTNINEKGSTQVDFGSLCEEAEKYYQSGAYDLITKIVVNGGIEAITDPVRRDKYLLATDILWGVVVYGKNGWERRTIAQTTGE